MIRTSRSPPSLERVPNARQGASNEENDGDIGNRDGDACWAGRRSRRSGQSTRRLAEPARQRELYGISRRCIEPELTAAEVATKRRAFRHVADAALAAYLGLPAVLVWDTKKRRDESP